MALTQLGQLAEVRAPPSDLNSLRRCAWTEVCTLSLQLEYVLTVHRPPRASQPLPSSTQLASPFGLDSQKRTTGWHSRNFRLASWTTLSGCFAAVPRRSRHGLLGSMTSYCRSNVTRAPSHSTTSPYCLPNAGSSVRRRPWPVTSVSDTAFQGRFSAQLDLPRLLRSSTQVRKGLLTSSIAASQTPCLRRCGQSLPLLLPSGTPIATDSPAQAISAIVTRFLASLRTLSRPISRAHCAP